MGGPHSPATKEKSMDIAALPEWLVWFAAGAIGAFALAALARILQAAFDLDQN
jgi:hypothetical protein